MQLVPALTKDPKVIRREASAGAHLPYARHIDDVTLQTRDGLLIQTIRLGGLLFETADSDETYRLPFEMNANPSAKMLRRKGCMLQAAALRVHTIPPESLLRQPACAGL